MSFVGFAVLSGAFGAVASSLAKLAFSSDVFAGALQRCQETLASDACYCDAIILAFRGLCFVGTLTLNIFMVGSFLEGMEESGSVAGTGLSSAANFLVSSLLGFLLWKEEFSSRWMLGFCLVIAGTLLLSTVKAEAKKAEGEKAKAD